MIERRTILLRTTPFLIAGLIVFVVYLAVFVDISEMIQVIREINLQIYFLAASLVILETTFFTLTWQYLLVPLSVKVPLKRVFMYVWIGIFADLLIPAESVSGEVVKAYLMSKEPETNTGKVVASLVSQRILGTIATILTLFLGFLALLTLDYSMSGLMLQILLSVILVSALAFCFLLVICVKRQWTERLIGAVMHLAKYVSRGRFEPERFQARIMDGLRSFYQSFKTFGSHPSRLLRPVVFYILTWLASISTVFFVFMSIGYLQPNIPTLLLKISIINTLMIAVKSIPIGVPAEVGLADIAMTTLFILFAIPANISAAVTVLTRILTVWLRFFIGFVAVQWLGLRNLIGSGIFGKTKNEI
jgi:uncharacterized protein (TIRG00374 family)